MNRKQCSIPLSLNETVSDGREETRKSATWQNSKLKNQADNFEIDELKILYSALFKIEKGMKTGNLVSNWTQTIDFLLLTI